MGLSFSAHAQSPSVTTRFAHPTYHATTYQYCVDVEFLSNTPSVQVFGMNVRFFYDDSVLELAGFSDFQGGYEAVYPNPPQLSTSASGPALFQFAGSAEFVNGAIQLVNPDATPILLDTQVWSKLFQVCFFIDDPNVNVESFCPSIVWDMEQDPENGGFLMGDDGVVITCVNPDPGMESTPAMEMVNQYNWIYTGSGDAPWGQPIQNVCLSLLPTLVINVPANVTIECTASTDPNQTGLATATDDCNGDPVISWSDSFTAGNCPGSFTMYRTWTAMNSCDETATGIQVISIIDSTSPVITCPSDVTLTCSSNTSPDVTGSATATDFSQPVIIAYGEYMNDGEKPGYTTITREWTATDACGNVSMSTQHIEWLPESPLICVIGVPDYVECNSDNVGIYANVKGDLEEVFFEWEIVSEKPFTESGMGMSEIQIHMGSSELEIIMTMTDVHGCPSTCSTTLGCTNPYEKSLSRPAYTSTPEVSKNQNQHQVLPFTGETKSSDEQMSDVSVWPNPTSENVNISVTTDTQRNIQFALTNFLGQVLLTDKIAALSGRNDYQINVSNIPEGNYVLQINTGLDIQTKTILITRHP